VEGGDCAGGVAGGGEANKGTTAGVEILGWREGDREEGGGRAEDFEGRVCIYLVSSIRMAGRATIELPGDETEVDLVSRTMILLSVAGVA
jgi:hypothetical protein